MRAGPGLATAINDAMPQQQVSIPRCRQRIKSPRVSPRARTRSRAFSCATLGTRTSTTSSIRSNRARCSASGTTVLTRFSAGRCNFDGAAATHRTPAAFSNRARPNPVGPASYATATGAGSSASHASTAPSGASRRRATNPITVSTRTLQPISRARPDPRSYAHRTTGPPANVVPARALIPRRQSMSTCE